MALLLCVPEAQEPFSGARKKVLFVDTTGISEVDSKILLDRAGIRILAAISEDVEVDKVSLRSLTPLKLFINASGIDEGLFDSLSSNTIGILYATWQVLSSLEAREVCRYVEALQKTRT